MGAGMTTKTVIVGAGPAGLAVTAMLGQRGVTFANIIRREIAREAGAVSSSIGDQSA